MNTNGVKPKKAKKINAKLIKRLKEHEETQIFRFAKKDRYFLMGTYGARIAREQGFDPLVSMIRIQEAISSKEEGQSSLELFRGQLLEDFSILLWWGFLPFEPALDLEEVQALLTIRELTNVASFVTDGLSAMSEDARAEGSLEDVTEGGEEGN